MMKKTISCLLLMLLLCASAAQAVTFTDDLGREVTVEAPARVAALTGSYADLWCLAGGADSLVAAPRDAFSDFGLPFTADMTDLGLSKKINLETVLGARPDLILASSATASNTALMDAFDQMNIPCAYFDIQSFEDHLRVLSLLTSVTGAPDRYLLYGEGQLEQIDRARARADGSDPLVLYVRVSTTGCKVKNSTGSILGGMLKDLGAVNIADSDDSLLENLSFEVIMQQDPAHIFIILQGSETETLEKVLQNTLTGDPAWASLTAVKNGQVHIMDARKYNLKPNALWGEAYEELADILYPQE